MVSGDSRLRAQAGIPAQDGLSPQALRGVDALLEAVDQRPCELSLDELVGLSTLGLQVQVDREGPSPVVYLTPDRDPVFAKLTRRERDVATLLAAGFANDQIASTLFVSLATVKGHVHSVFEKTGFTSRTQVVAAWYGGLASGPDRKAAGDG